MKRRKYSLCAEFWLRRTMPMLEWVRALIAPIPDSDRPTHAGNTELFNRRRACPIDDEKTISEYLHTRQIFWLYGKGMHIGVVSGTESASELDWFDSSASRGARLIPQWIGHLDSMNLVYATAALLEEYDHRNGYTVRYIEGGSASGHGWVGRDYRRYVPGLYWLNYFSREFLRDRHVDINGVSQRVGGTLHELSNGFLLQLYETPEQWRAETDKIDSILENEPGFFSKRKTDIPAIIPFRQIPDLISRLGKEWP